MPTGTRRSGLAPALLATIVLAGAARPAAAAGECPAAPILGAIYCDDAGLRSLAGRIGARYRALLAKLPPRGAAALKRDQRWFVDMVGGGYSDQAAETDLPARARFAAVLTTRADRLARMGTGRSRPAGAWANVFGTVDVRPLGRDLRLVVETRSDYDEGVVAGHVCRLEATLAPGADGWYAGRPARPAEVDRPDATLPTVALRLQGGLLRLVLRVASNGMEQSFCTHSDQITGTYFPVGEDADGAGGEAVEPSFACRGALDGYEEEVCADPDLAALDRRMADAYAAALKTLPAPLAAALRADQRAFAAANRTAWENGLRPPWDKRSYATHKTTFGRAVVRERLERRLAILERIDPARTGFAGEWRGHDSSVTVKTDPQGRLSAAGWRGDVADYKAHCDYRSEGAATGDAFARDEGDPVELRLERGVLVVDGGDPDARHTTDVDGPARPDYCSRLRSAAARLLPVKPGTAAPPIQPGLE